MQKDYEILGLAKGASEQEIKKAYFKLVRKYSPESDPEQFQKIREAYEHLKAAGQEEEEIMFPPMEEPWAEKMLSHIKKLAAEKDWEWCRDACEEAWKRFPEYKQFLYFLIKAQQKCGNTGKAVKNAERLADMEPENKWFQRELATAYLKRGYMKKAMAAFERAYEMGCGDTDFMLAYSWACKQCGQCRKGSGFLLDLVKQERKWPRERLVSLAEAYIGLFAMYTDRNGKKYGEILECFSRSMDQYRFGLSEHMPVIAAAMSEAYAEDETGENYRKTKELFAQMKKYCRGEMAEGAVAAALEELQYRRLRSDARIGETLADVCETCVYMEDSDAQLVRFVRLDMLLCMLEKRSEVLDQAEILKKEYPEYYEKLEDLIEKLRTEKNLDFFKERLLKDYCRLESNYDGGMYFEKYPGEKNRHRGKVLSGWDSDEPYVRGTKKIGRNDPCPCGSGKKYKHCCMNKM